MDALPTAAATTHITRTNRGIQKQPCTKRIGRNNGKGPHSGGGCEWGPCARCYSNTGHGLRLNKNVEGLHHCLNRINFTTTNEIVSVTFGHKQGVPRHKRFDGYESRKAPAQAARRSWVPCAGFHPKKEEKKYTCLGNKKSTHLKSA
jgi:hypothetical protein